MPAIRALVFDLDRTLLRSDRSVSAYTRSVLDRCRSKGLYIIIATARPPRSIADYETLLRPDAVVTMNGASLRMNGQEKHSISMEAHAVQQLIQAIDRLLPEHTWSMELQSGLYANFDTSKVWAGPAAPRVTVDTVPFEAAYKVLVGLENEADVSVLRSLLPDNSYLEISEGTLGMVIHREATKLHGVEMALRELGVPMAEAAAFGDDLADVGMLQACGFGIAVANALPEVKAAADFVTASNDEDGVAKWLAEHAGI